MYSASNYFQYIFIRSYTKICVFRTKIYCVKIFFRAEWISIIHDPSRHLSFWIHYSISTAQCKQAIYLEVEAMWIRHPWLHIQNKRLVCLRYVDEEIDDTVSGILDGTFQVHPAVLTHVSSLYYPHWVRSEGTSLTEHQPCFLC